MIMTQRNRRGHVPLPPPGIDESALVPLLMDILAKLEEVRKAIIAPPRGTPDQGHPSVHIERVRVTTVGQARQGPDMAVPPGYKTAIRQRNHPSTAPIGYVAFKKEDIGNGEKRIELADGQSFEVDIANWNHAWFDADTANTDFELVVEMLRV